MGEWRTIDSAPKDGSAILVFAGEFVEKAAWRWIDKNKSCGWWIAQVRDDDASHGEDGYNSPVFRDPSHWMPLPPPP